MFLKKGSKISLDKFIYKALYDKNKGYYMKGNPIGSKGEFITSQTGFKYIIVCSLFCKYF